MLPNEAELLTTGVKSPSTSKYVTHAASPEEVLFTHRSDVNQLVSNAHSSGDVFGDFLQLVSAISERQDQFMKDAGTRTISYERTWDALMLEVCNSALPDQLRQWLSWRDPVFSEVLDSELPELVKPDISANQLPQKLSVFSLAHISTPQPEEEDDADSDTSRFARHVLSSVDSALRFLQQFREGCQLLEKTHIQRFTQSAIKETVAETIEHIVQSAAGKWGTECLDILRMSIASTMAVFDTFISSPSYSIAEFSETQLFTRFSDLRTSELFSIIIDYPDTRAAISDLHDCVKQLNNLRSVATSLRAAIQKRLLHPGATTNDILTQYISAIRCLRLLDPTSTVLEIVAGPIRGYLRSREDTVMCIVQDMVAEESELFEDLASGGIIEDDEAGGLYLTAQRRDADVLSLLVSIFDTKDVFVEEFEKHLAHQLLLCADYETQREIKQVEMMKLRFGDEALERCEVMLKDLADSKRADQYIAEVSVHNGWEMPMHTTVVSRQFWGSVPSEQFTMPAEMASLRDQSLKAARKLEWRDALGAVTLEIGLADRTLEVSAKPAQAAVSQALECSEEFALPRIRFWQARGVIRETSGGVFEVAESEAMATDATRNADKSIDDTAEEDGLEEVGALRVHFKYVVGMLTNFGPLPLDRIHSMLDMFLPGEKIEPDELKAFLALMVREDRLEQTGGMYKLK
ncbi:hypothetical protein DL89DRAFT_269815 [Linderina pennispora]|uniref:Anaphase-promoting complex subunit 2 n=1 Tax=Linderina pennispora TaxID=61395 RepID=A0A1Y1VZT3_9FUNG|nr:uncharacterized protein DL89DRAFT_269815 [Linderina pennispora]ORX66771.1 hypothetical protein DL89DRAFT_269815 [Linderina pennispora]